MFQKSKEGKAAFAILSRVQQSNDQMAKQHLHCPNVNGIAAFIILLEDRRSGNMKKVKGDVVQRQGGIYEIRNPKMSSFLEDVINALPEAEDKSDLKLIKILNVIRFFLVNSSILGILNTEQCFCCC